MERALLSDLATAVWSAPEALPTGLLGAPRQRARNAATGGHGFARQPVNTTARSDAGAEGRNTVPEGLKEQASKRTRAQRVVLNVGRDFGRFNRS